MRAVRFDGYGGIEVLTINQVPTPIADEGWVVVEVEAAGINPGEAAIRQGHLDDRFPATFPSGQGSDLAGVVAEVGAGVAGFALGDEVLGWSEERSSQAEFVAVPATQLVAKPPALPWAVAGSLFVAGCAAYGAVGAIAPVAGQTVVVSGAAGGVGTVAVQLLRDRDVRVIGIASPDNHGWLGDLGAVGVAYGDDLEADLAGAAPGGIDGWVDVFGGGYVELAIRLGVAPERIDTIIDFEAVAAYGVKAIGTHQIEDPQAALAELAAMAADGRLQIPVAATYPLEQVREAFTELEKRHTHGKIVLLP